MCIPYPRPLPTANVTSARIKDVRPSPRRWWGETVTVRRQLAVAETFRLLACVETQARCCDDAASPQYSVIYGEDNTNG
jgi:hypothetical protein